MSKYINNWKPEVKSALQSLMNAGCVIVKGHNGEDEFSFNGNLNKFIEEATACDECYIYVTTPTSVPDTRADRQGKLTLKAIYFVLGNSPGELFSDYTVDPAIEKAAIEHGDKWENRPQPKKLCPHFVKEAKRITAIAHNLNTRTENGKNHVIYYGVVGVTPVPFPFIAGASFYTKEGKSFGCDVTQLWYGIEGQPVQTEVAIIGWLTDAAGKQLFPRK